MAKYLKPQTPLQHQSGDYIYPITTADQIITAKGERLNANLISVDLNESVESDTNINLVNNKPKAGFIYPLASNIVPEGFLLCDGAEYLRAEYPELFAAIGTMYGSGNGSSTFNVPNLQTRVPVGAGDDYELGDVGGEAEHTLTVYEMPSHRHEISTAASGGTDFPSGYSYTSSGSKNEAFCIPSGGSQPHNNMQPYTVVNYIIATGKDTGVNVTDIIAGVQALPLGIGFGGTGATNAAIARKNLEITPDNIGAVSMELLWKNDSPTSSFAAQTISLDLSKYDEVLVRFRTYISQNATISSQGGIGEDVIVSYIWGDTGNYSHRWAKIKSDGVQFYDSSYNKGKNNEYCIPWKIYGIKGVS